MDEFSCHVNENGYLYVSFSEAERYQLVEALSKVIRKFSSRLITDSDISIFDKINRASRMAISLQMSDELNALSKEDIDVLNSVELNFYIKNLVKVRSFHSSVKSDCGTISIVNGDSFAKNCIAAIHD